MSNPERQLQGHSYSQGLCILLWAACCVDRMDPVLPGDPSSSALGAMMMERWDDRLQGCWCRLWLLLYSHVVSLVSSGVHSLIAYLTVSCEEAGK